MRRSRIVILVLVIFSCQSPSQLENVLEAAGENRKALESVIQYFEKSENPEKLKAAQYLIANMEGKYWLDGREKEKFDPLLVVIDSLWKAGERVNFSHKELLGNYWDSLKSVKGPPRIRNAQVNLDYKKLNAEFLIRHIEQAFDLRENLPWCQNLSFANFCAYVLPYRVGKEIPENWIPPLKEKWKTLRDTLPHPDRMKLAQVINDENAYYMKHMGLFWSYPFDMTASEFERVRLGSCKHGVYYTTMAMRANGLPVAVDFVPQWAGSNAGHEWNVLLQEDGTFYPFDAINRGFELDLSFRKVAKVFRKTFSAQELPFDKEDLLFIPDGMKAPFRKDVTQEYVNTFDVKVSLNRVPENTDKVLISTFDNKNWVPQYWGKVKGKQAHFKNMGAGIVYMAMSLDHGRYQQLSDPFLLDSLGRQVPLKADMDKKQDMDLTRKYPLTSFMEGIMGFVVGNHIQGANARDFRDSVTFFSIDKIPQKIETKNIQDQEKYRYVRMWIPEGGRGDMAELEFYGLDHGDTVKLEGEVIGDSSKDVSQNRFYAYPFDGDLLTYFLKPRQKEPWVGLDLGSPKRIVKVRYCPRSDTNFIEVGDTYELFYWQEGDWKSLGRKVAQKQALHYQQVPSGGLYILRNLTKGKEERIFTYKDGKQFWW